MIRYQVRNFSAKADREFESEAEAREYAELVANQSGCQSEVIKWAVSPNLPNALPALVYRSCALEVFDPSTGWRGVNIHGC
jgi:hypothetical protein